MATQPNWVAVPVKLGLAATATNLINAAAVCRTPTSQPVNITTKQTGGGGGSTNNGPQLWPV